MSGDFTPKPSCDGCGATESLYGSTCKHMTLCFTCGKALAEEQAKCRDCGATITRLIREEYKVRICSRSDKNYFIGKFAFGIPPFSGNKNEENKWTIQKEGLEGRKVTDALREKYKNKPWLLKDKSGQFQYKGVLEGGLTAIYYLLILGTEGIVAIPTGSWYKFSKIPKCSQLTLDQAEEMMKSRSKTVQLNRSWMMKGQKTKTSEEGNVSDKGEAVKQEVSVRKSPKGGDRYMDGDDTKKGDDWEHEEIFTDDEEAVGNDPEERIDLVAEIPPPPEIKQEVKPVKSKATSTSKGSVSAEGASYSKSGPTSTSGRVTRVETPASKTELISGFESRLKSEEVRHAFQVTVNEKSRKTKRAGDRVLRDK